MLDSHDRIALVHAVFGSLAGLFVIPAAVLVGRFARANPNWWRTHALLNVIGALLVVLTFALGMASVGTADEGAQFSGDEADLHHKLGLAVFLIVIVQAMLGAVAHYAFRPRATAHKTASDASHPGSMVEDKVISEAHPTQYAPEYGRSALLVRCAHVALGITAVGLLYWCMWDGIHTEWASMSDDHSVAPTSVQVLFWICVLVPLTAYLLRAGSDVLTAIEHRHAPALR